MANLNHPTNLDHAAACIELAAQLLQGSPRIPRALEERIGAARSRLEDAVLGAEYEGVEYEPDDGELSETELRAEDERDVAEHFPDLSRLERRIIIAARQSMAMTQAEERKLAADVAAEVRSAVAGVSLCQNVGRALDILATTRSLVQGVFALADSQHTNNQDDCATLANVIHGYLNNAIEVLESDR